MRTAYILTASFTPQRAERTESILKEIGFNVDVRKALDCNGSLCLGNRIKSNLLSFKSILEEGIQNQQDWFYFFEDDISIAQPTSLQEIIEYENISKNMFYLGCCLGAQHEYIKTDYIINNHSVYKLTKGIVRCIHALGISKAGAEYLIKLIESDNYTHADIAVNQHTIEHGTNCMRFDITSPQNYNHRGIFYQDRFLFKSEI